MLLGLRVPDADHGPAFGVRVGVGPVLEDLVGEGHDVFVVAGHPAAGAGAHARAVVGHVARVGVDERGEEEEGEGGEGGDAHCCGDGGGGGKGVVAFAGCKERYVFGTRGGSLGWVSLRICITEVAMFGWLRRKRMCLLSLTYIVKGIVTRDVSSEDHVDKITFVPAAPRILGWMPG